MCSCSWNCEKHLLKRNIPVQVSFAFSLFTLCGLEESVWFVTLGHLWQRGLVCLLVVSHFNGKRFIGDMKRLKTLFVISQTDVGKVLLEGHAMEVKWVKNCNIWHNIL